MPNPIKPLNALLIKPAGPDCNLACDYCFYLEKDRLFPEGPHRMSEACLETLIRQGLEQSGREISFGWQGGEPTLMGLPFFEKAVAFQERYGENKVVGNGLQTNGLLIDEAWIEFLRKYNFLVGLSLDGPAHIHDRYRQRGDGSGSFERVEDRARAMLAGKVQVNALSVVNDYSVRFPDEIYDYHRALGLDFMQFIPLQAPAGREALQPTPEAYGDFLIALFDRWIDDFKDGGPTSSIRFFESVFHVYAEVPPPECTLHKTCGIYLVVEHDGGVYACDFFVEPGWHLGNIREDRLVDLLNSDRMADFGRRKADLPEACYACPWLRNCRGGCPAERTGNLHRHCTAFKRFFKHAHPRLLSLATAWKAEQRASRPATAPSAGRNDPCPCGSKRKYKKCCGRGG